MSEPQMNNPQATMQSGANPNQNPEDRPGTRPQKPPGYETKLATAEVPDILKKARELAGSVIPAQSIPGIPVAEIPDSGGSGLQPVIAPSPPSPPTPEPEPERINQSAILGRCARLAERPERVLRYVSISTGPLFGPSHWDKVFLTAVTRVVKELLLDDEWISECVEGTLSFIRNRWDPGRAVRFLEVLTVFEAMSRVSEATEVEGGAAGEDGS